MIIAAYKGKGTFFDSLIRWWTKSPYSHVEIVLHRNQYYFKGFSSSTRDGGVRVKSIKVKSGHWDFFEADAPRLEEEEMRKHIGKGYDFMGILLSQILPLKRHSKRRFFCSELCAHMMGLSAPQKYSPDDLVKHIKFGGE